MDSAAKLETPTGCRSPMGNRGEVPAPRPPTGLYGPIEVRPKSLTPPHDVYAEKSPTSPDFAAELREALSGLELGTYDERIVEWLAGWELVDCRRGRVVVAPQGKWGMMDEVYRPVEQLRQELRDSAQKLATLAGDEEARHREFKVAEAAWREAKKATAEARERRNAQARALGDHVRERRLKLAELATDAGVSRPHMIRLLDADATQMDATE